MHRRQVAVVILAFVVAALVLGSVAGPDEPGVAGDPQADRLVQPGGDGAVLWPYTSRERSVAGRTLPINVVVVGDADRVRTQFEDRTDANWSSADGDAALGATPWRHASGAVRYSYVADAPNATGRWIDSDYQLGVGSYFTTRTHVRAYAAPSTAWTALQAHTEYWDWFRLRHTVTSTGAGAEFVERDLRDQRDVTDLRREYHGVGGSADTGWISVIEFGSATVALPATLPTPAALGGSGGSAGQGSLAGPGSLAGHGGAADSALAGLAIGTAAALAGASAAVVGFGPGRRRSDWPEPLLLPVALVGIVLGVRALGVAGAEAFAGTNPLVLAGLLYPVLTVGPLVAAVRLSPGGDAALAAALSAGGLGVGVVADLTLVGVAAVPIRLALHRIALAGALAVVAVGAAGTDRRVTAAGVAAWVVVLAAPLAGVV